MANDTSVIYIRAFFRVFAIGFLVLTGCNNDDDDPEQIIEEPEYVFLNSQQEVNDFGAKGDSVVLDFLYIGPNGDYWEPDDDYFDEGEWVINYEKSLGSVSSDISDLTPLTNLTFVSGSVYIYNNDNLKSLNGLQNIDRYSSLEISGNDLLTSLVALENISAIDNLGIRANNLLGTLEALENMSIVNNLIISDNPQLTSLDGLHNISEVNGSLIIARNNLITSLEELGNVTGKVGGLNIRDNPKLTSLNGLQNISEVGGLSISGGLTTLGLQNLTKIEYGLKISGTQITHLQDFNNLTYAPYNGIIIEDNKLLKSLDGLVNHSNGWTVLIDITGNDSLTSLEGLDSMTSISHRIRILDNKSLTSLNGLQNLKVHSDSFFTNGFIIIERNDMLTDFCAIRDFVIGLEELQEKYNNNHYYYRVSDNIAFNPTASQLVNGDCKQ
ncbi:MAG: leucine-rich repeat domain-containing protein [Cytophagales bacterium]|nr:leucine-rich repeat domain-containing protein [Cytophagales bacterium]